MNTVWTCPNCEDIISTDPYSLVRFHKRMCTTDIHTLGQLIDTLSQLDPTLPVQFDGIRPHADLTQEPSHPAVPARLTTWRGAYEDLTLGSTGDPHPSPPTVADVLADAKNTVDATLSGYKGGDFLMDRDSRLWADEYGHADGYRITDIVEQDGVAVIFTATDDD